MWKNNISFVLVEPKEPGNIGSAARALKNMGFKNLEMVNPVNHFHDEARWFARNSLDVLERAKIHESYAGAIENKSLVVGTTRRVGKMRGLVLPLKELAPRLAGIAAGNRVAIVFGREDRGLTTDEARQCGYLITIPAHPGQPSLNLAHAVLVVAYELSQFEAPAVSERFVHGDSIKPLLDRVRGLVARFGYKPTGYRDMEESIMNNIQHILGRSGLTSWELRMLQGLCTRLETGLGGGQEDGGKKSHD
jgi:TrmH family RNA methyltransferase